MRQGRTRRSKISRSVLVVAAHPDDETVAGAPSPRSPQKEPRLHLLFLADGVSARREQEAEREALTACRRMGNEAAHILGAEPPTYIDLPDNRLDGVDLLDIVVEVGRIGPAVRPDLVPAHFSGDFNVDHRIAAKAALTASRSAQNQSVRSVWSFEVPFSAEWAFGATRQAGCGRRLCRGDERLPPPPVRRNGIGACVLAQLLRRG